MGKTLEEAVKKTVAVADIVKHGEKLIIPDNMELTEAIDLIQRRMKYETEEVVIQENFPAFPWDGANAFELVLIDRYGWAPASSSFFSTAQLINIEIGFNQWKKVPWGQFKLPGITGTLYTQGATDENGLLCFKIMAKVLRQHETEINVICNLVREKLKTNSIYRGKAISLRLYDDNGDKLDMAMPKFMDTQMKEHPIYSKHIEDAIDTNLYTPIERTADCIANGISVKRGVLLAGTYGTGKTLTAKAAAYRAEKVNVTFIYVQRAAELPDAIKFSKHYEHPAVVLFCEDIDRTMKGDRSVKIDELLNCIDGVDSKNRNLITILTTNDVESINAAMMRPGRLDAIIEVLPPDAEAVQRLLRSYGGSAIEDNADLTDAGEALAGAIPAVIAEVVRRAKLSQLRFQAPGTLITQLTGAALCEAARTMRAQIDLLERAARPKTPPVTLDVLVKQAVVNGVHEYTESGVKAVKAA